jgi:hypothetical protein
LGYLSNVLRIKFTLSGPHNVSHAVWSGVGGVDGAVLAMACNDSGTSASSSSSGSGSSSSSSSASSSNSTSGNCYGQVVLGGNFSAVNTSFDDAKPAPYHLARLDLLALGRADWAHAISPVVRAAAGGPSRSALGYVSSLLVSSLLFSLSLSALNYAVFLSVSVSVRLCLPSTVVSLGSQQLYSSTYNSHKGVAPRSWTAGGSGLAPQAGNVSTLSVAGNGRIFAGGEFSFPGDDGARYFLLALSCTRIRFFSLLFAFSAVLSACCPSKLDDDSLDLTPP